MVKVEDQKSTGSVLLVTDGDAYMTLLLDFENNGEPNSGTIRLYKKSYDESAKEFVEDQEVFNKTLDDLHEYFQVSEENSINLKDQGHIEIDSTIEEIEQNDDREFELFYDGDRLSLYPIKSFPRFDNSKIDKKIAKELKTLLKSDEQLSGIPISDHVLRHQFNIGFTADINGEELNFRISSLLNEDEEKVVKTKYTNRTIEDLEKQVETMQTSLEEDDLTEDRAEGLKKKIEKSTKGLNKMVERYRQSKEEELSEVYGMDIEEAIEDGYTVDLVITDVFETALANPNTDGNYYYMNARVASEPYIAE